MRTKAKREDKGEWKGFKKSKSDDDKPEDDDDDTMDAPVPQKNDTSDSGTDSDSGAKDDNGLAIAANGKRTIMKSSMNALLVGLDDADCAGDQGQDESHECSTVAEAKARKKYRAAQTLLKIQKKKDAINETGYLGEGEVDLYLPSSIKAGAKKPNKSVQLAVAKGTNKGNKGHPNGIQHGGLEDEEGAACDEDNSQDDQGKQP
ncbi:hypothetical protein BGZ65_004024 [Modicella reniformis]|uniref:Ribosomal RNA methyltransferase SPB1-like C-terminal domain-containing protein n=1 Tax=Modicella reniformis TaxID=1440133 RepID=A0A9P6LSY5_9FUNG|nr:hypothetical protein BGZ65_004024 [Modicella reniformis]